LVADVGGTNARFALVDADDRVRKTTIVPCAAHGSLVEAIEAYIGGLKWMVRPRTAVLAVACPVWGDRIKMTNRAWSFSARQTRDELHLHQLCVINDFAALALAIPYLRSRHKPVIKPGRPVRSAPIGVIGPGTGLGVAGLVPAGGAWLPLSSEGGHRDAAATTDREWAVVKTLQRHFGSVSVERILSGPGLVNIYRALAEIDGQEPDDLEAATIAALGAQGDDRRCEEAVRMFSGQLGAVAGDLALTFGARGGIFIGGGVVRRMGRAFDVDLFCRRFLAKGRFAEFLDPIPVRLITHPTAALLGAAHYAI
jgi:glucokinase